MSEEKALQEGAARLGVALSVEQGAQLLAYSALILKWNKVYNLTAVREPASVLTHHLLDSLAIIGPLARQCPSAGRLLDVGSGAGLPGVVVAILRPDLYVTCVDAVAKKMAFVQQVSAELRIANVRGVHARVETLGGSFDVISSRAFAPLADFFSGSGHLLASGGQWLAMKGKTPGDELAQVPPAIKVFHVEQLTVPGLDAERCIVWARKAIA